ncbi:MAG TPA: radical SAM protein [Acidobacteriaceae bacterium]|nr:radical SAM protein [Acidobacteriaceae bacterium]
MFFVLKLSKLCNLRCTYCYEFDELGSAARMPLEGLDQFFASLAADQPQGGWPLLRFVFHGGEPLLLPHEYLRRIVDSQRRHLAPAGIAFVNSLQTNLTRLDNATLSLLDDLHMGLGISLDVFGEQRLHSSGVPSQPLVLKNLQTLIDTGAIQRLGVGIISVLHRQNLHRVVGIYEFCRTLSISCRILPVFSVLDPPTRMRELMLSHAEVVDALRRVAIRWLETGMPINVFPLSNYLEAAIHKLLGLRGRTYDPRYGDWAYIVNTNGDTFSHAEAYSAEGWMGNIFKQSFVDILRSPAHEHSLEPRLQRAEICTSCRYASACSHIPLVESLSSERGADRKGKLTCPVALPMIDFFCERLAEDQALADLLETTRKQSSACLMQV